ncbi:diacylglycerol glucosyltransferase [Paenibacillus sp. CAA11]|uniref:MGDG synthase family glycosyltransferase n=1 Tax=Paenibacillus sp. CAA11 TaxID=1532905 RepID=UPI000D34EF21|nr:glycosyltransferase [Paenibacillus sp. CAA11]AWB43267.1 diacylglycerol glucosyltransferase [Paenibacillus sp. CAA11]
MKSPKILILYASYGDGHYQASKAIEDRFHAKGYTDVVLLDLMAEAHPMLNELTKFVYMQSFKTIPAFYGWVYNATKDMQPGRPFSNLLHSIGITKLQQLISEAAPDLIIHTFPQLVMPRLLKKTGLALPLVNVLTDFDIHGRWIHPGVDRYYVATEDLKAELVTKGVPEERVLASGIPLKAGFGESREDRCNNSGKRNVLLMAGAFGVMQGLRDICHALTLSGQYHITVVCGKNKELYRNLQTAFGGHPDIDLYGFVENIPDLMAASDCIITKPGGITLSEAIASRLPLFLYRPVPGQELNNALYLEGKGIATIAYDPYELALDIEALFRNEERRAGLLETLEELSRPHAANTIVEDLIGQYLSAPAASLLLQQQ